MRNGLAIVPRGTTYGSTTFFSGAYEAPGPQGFNLGAIIRGGISLLTGIPGGGGPKPPQQQLVPSIPSSIGQIITSPTPSGTIRGIGGLLTGIGSLVPSPAQLLGIGAGKRRARRMNPLNLRALGRADRRLTRFAKIARRYVSRSAPQRAVRTRKRGR